MQQRDYYREVGKDALFKIWHASDNYMLIYTYSNGGSIVCGENLYPIRRGVLCLIGAAKYHYTMPDDPQTYDRAKLFLSPEDFRRILQLGGLEETFADASFAYAQLDEDAQRTAEKILAELNPDEEGSPYRGALLAATWLRLLVLLDRFSLESTAAPTGFLNHAMDYVNRNILSEITIDAICDAVHMSKYYFCRKFKESTGMTVMDYVLKTRIVLAKSMLVKESMSITEISERCCFSSVSYFCRVFKEDTGLTPTAYRRQRRG
jgi:AraC-like DNA-binding protein